MGIEDELTEKYSREQRQFLISAFATSCRRTKYGKHSKNILKGGTVKATVTNAHSTFRTNLWPDPALDANTKPSLFLTRQLVGYVDADTLTKQQKALPPSVFRSMLRNKLTPTDESLIRLAGGAFYFGMRSCEFLTVKGDRKTKQLKIRNIHFFKNNFEIKDKTNRLIIYADTVLITFEFQKNKKKDFTVKQPRSGKELCPVIIWDKIVLQILSYKGTTKNTPVNGLVVGKTQHYIKTEEMYEHIVNTVNTTPGLGFTGDDVGNHSICSSLAMVLYLAKQAVTTIILIGRWCSDAFLLYVRRKVQEFSMCISADMAAIDH